MLDDGGKREPGGAGGLMGHLEMRELEAKAEPLG